LSRSRAFLQHRVEQLPRGLVATQALQQRLAAEQVEQDEADVVQRGGRGGHQRSTPARPGTGLSALSRSSFQVLALPLSGVVVRWPPRGDVRRGARASASAIAILAPAGGTSATVTTSADSGPMVIARVACRPKASWPAMARVASTRSKRIGTLL